MPKNRDDDSSHSAKNQFDHLDDDEMFELLNAELGRIAVMEAKHNRNVHEKIQFAALMAIWLQDDPERWRRFCAAVEWGGIKAAPDESDSEDAFRFVMRWLCGLDDAGNKKASLYYNSVASYLKQGGEAAELSQQIKTEGSLAKFRLKHSAGSTSGRANRSSVAVNTTRAPTTVSKRSSADEDDEDGDEDSALMIRLELSAEDLFNIHESVLPRVMTLKVEFVERLASGGLQAKLLRFKDRDDLPPEHD